MTKRRKGKTRHAQQDRVGWANLSYRKVSIHINVYDIDALRDNTLKYLIELAIWFINQEDFAERLVSVWVHDTGSEHSVELNPLWKLYLCPYPHIREHISELSSEDWRVRGFCIRDTQEEYDAQAKRILEVRR